MGWWKDKEREALKNEVRTKINSIHEKFSQLDWNTESDGKAELSLRGLSKEWGPFVEGMDCRILDLGDSTNVTVVQCRVLFPFEMERHWHFESEVTISLDLEMIDMETGITYGPLDSVKWGSNVKHRPKFITTGMILVIFSPALSKE